MGNNWKEMDREPVKVSSGYSPLTKVNLVVFSLFNRSIEVS